MISKFRRCIVVVTTLLLTLASAVMPRRADALPPIRHVFVIILENASYADTFNKLTQSPYLAKTLVSQGALLKNYYGIGHYSLDNYIAMISGQPPNRDTQFDCPVYTDFVLRKPGLNKDGIALGHGCVYPAMVKTLPVQLDAAHLTWRGYMEDMGKDPSREAATCGHARIGARDPLLTATLKDQYASKHDPFIYFHSIIDRQAYCDAHVVNLDALKMDLQSVDTTPNFSYIVPNLCHDGHDAPCVGRKEPGGPLSFDPFLRTLVPLILQSPAFKQDGLLIITFDEAASVSKWDSSACCGEKPMPGARYSPGGRGLVGETGGSGGGRVGAVVLSPFIKPGTVSMHPYNHYSLLRTVEDIFGLKHLAYAGGKQVRSFGKDVFTAQSR